MEEAVQFECYGKKLYGILHTPDQDPRPSTVLLIINGGPQTRVGGHRLYVQLSRFLCHHGIASLRFDYEGLGDSEGSFVGYQGAEPSITSSINFLHQRFNNKIDIILWSLCDGATAAVLSTVENKKNINRLFLCNPYVLTEESLARTSLWFYYKNRLFDQQFWQKVFKFNVNYRETIRSLWKTLSRANVVSYKKTENSPGEKKSLSDSVVDALVEFKKPVNIVLSSNDVVAVNFLNVLKKHKNRIKDNNDNIVHHFIYGADHTFIEPSFKKELFSLTLDCIKMDDPVS